VQRQPSTKRGLRGAGRLENDGGDHRGDERQREDEPVKTRPAIAARLCDLFRIHWTFRDFFLKHRPFVGRLEQDEKAFPVRLRVKTPSAGKHQLAATSPSGFA